MTSTTDQTVSNNSLSSNADFDVRTAAKTHGKKTQVFSLDVGTGTTELLVDSSNPLPVTASSFERNGTWTAAAVSAGTIGGIGLVGLANRKRFSICHNQSGAYIFIKFGGVASSTDYHLILDYHATYMSDLYEFAGDIGVATSAGTFNVLFGEQS